MLPVQNHAINWNIVHLLSIGPLRTNFSEIPIKIQSFYIKRYAFENVVGKMVVIVFRPQSVKRRHPSSGHPLGWFADREAQLVHLHTIWNMHGKSHPRTSYVYHFINTLRPRQHGRHFPDDIFKCIFLNEHVKISIKMSLKFVPKGPINIIPALVQIMAWRRPGDKPLSEPMMVSLLTHICVTRPQWVNKCVTEWAKETILRNVGNISTS